MKIIKIVILILILGSLGYVTKHFFFKPKDFLYSGTLEGTQVDLSAQLPSTLSEVKVHEGDKVSSGDSLVVLSCEDVRIINQLASENYVRAQKLISTGTLSQDAFDQIKNKKQEADLHLQWCQIQAPIQGTVLSRYREPGEWVGPGMKVLTLVNIQDIWAYIYVPQPDVAQLQTGMKVTGTVPEIPDRIFEGVISHINSEAEFTPKNVQTQSERTRLVFGVKISFLGSNTDEILKPGMSIEIKL